ncbi:MAG: endonuclease III [Clostridia bacterium]
MEDKYEQILQRLKDYYGSPKTALHFDNPLQLLIATILSAQCTDDRVNKITPSLFEKYETAKDFADADIKEIEDLIRTCGLFRNKSKFIKSAATDIFNNFNGLVPDNRKDLESLAGVGRKTANVVLANVFGKQAIAVDTHVFRVSKRLGFSSGKNVLEVEKDLMDKIPKEVWADAHHWFIYHGREICKARKPKCSECYLSNLCSYYQKKYKN